MNAASNSMFPCVQAAEDEAGVEKLTSAQFAHWAVLGELCRHQPALTDGINCETAIGVTGDDAAASGVQAVVHGTGLPLVGTIQVHWSPLINVTAYDVPDGTAVSFGTS